MKKITLLSLLFFSLLFSSNLIQSQTISGHFFGENAWMPDTIGKASACIDPPCVLYGKLHKKWGLVKLSKASMIRVGGITPDKNMPTNFQYIKMIDSIRANGMEPIIQVPFYKYRYTAQQAANIVKYINVTRGKKIKYWIIGNEPDLSYQYTTASQVAAYFKPFASAMKAIDPTILIIGPECAWFNKGIIDGLTNPNGPDDITGKDGSGRYYIDVISFHTYPFNGSQTRSQVISNLTSPGKLQDNLVYLNGRINNCNVAHNRTGTYALKTAITEANVGFQNSSTDNLYGVGANSFIGGQFIAEMMGIGMKNKLDFINIWSVVEGNTTALNIGYIDGATGNKKPNYYHFKMLAENFSGSFAKGTTNQINVKSLGSKNSQNIIVMIMNQDQTINYNFTLRLNTGTVSGSNPLKINIDANIPVQYNDVISNQTTLLLTFDPQGMLIKKCTYSLANHAAFNLPPSCEYMPIILPIGLTQFDVTLNNNRVELAWKTANEINNDFFTIQRTIDGINYEDIDTVKGAGNSNQMIHYLSFDETPYNGLSYYRLKQTDFNGSVTYSAPKAVELKMSQLELILYPNPSDGSILNLDMNTAYANHEMSFLLYDMQGKAVHNEIKVNVHEPKKISLNFQYKLPPGIYLLISSDDSNTYKNKFIVGEK